MATRFDSRHVSPTGLTVIDEYKEAAERLAQTIDRTVASSRERALAQTHLQEAVMWATRAASVYYDLNQVTPGNQ